MRRRYYVILVELVLLLYLTNSGAAQYQWACTEPNDAGQRYIPSVRDLGVLTDTTVGNLVNIYRLPQNLRQQCYGKVVEIEYCYLYNTAMEGPAVFNWTVLILNDQNMGHSRFTVMDKIIIESRSNTSANCSEAGMCCDVTRVNRSVDLSRNFAFGVTESSQGNTHSASLLAFADSRTQYTVDTILLNRDEHDLSVGSPLPSTPVVQRGLRMLWFVTDKESVNTRDVTTTSSDNDSTVAEISSSVMYDVIVGSVIGAIFGCFLLLTILLLLLALVWRTWKYKRVLQENEAYQLQQPKGERSRGVTAETAEQQLPDIVNQSIETESNEAYVSQAALRIKTEDNVAYVCFENAQPEYDYV